MALFPRLATAVAGVLILLSLGSLDWRPSRPETPARLQTSVGASDILRAGAGRAELQLPADVTLAGYRPFGRAPTEAGLPLHARSLLLEAGGVRVALVLLEQMTIPAPLVEKIQGLARASGASCTLVVGSHTHSGPGGYDGDFLPQVVIGRFDTRVERAILEAVAASLAAARGDLTHASLSWAEKNLQGMNANRDDKLRPVDTRLGRLRLVRGDGSPVATLVRFSAHPTLMPREVGPAGDWPGFAMEQIEGEGGVAFVLPGTVGDARVAPGAAPGEGSIRALLYGQSIAGESRKLAGELLAGPTPLGCATAEFSLPPANLGRMVPPIVGPLVSNLVSPWAPARASVAALRMGPVLLAAVPAEPVLAVSQAIEDGWPDTAVRVIGVGQGYVGYTPDPPAWETRAPSARNAWFGVELGPRIQNAAEVAVGAALEAATSKAGAAVASPWPE